MTAVHLGVHEDHEDDENAGIGVWELSQEGDCSQTNKFKAEEDE
ncbi:MAG: hypothetical protein ACKO3R_10050 [bacterium]